MASVDLDLQFRRPDYSFRPTETPKQKSGPLKTNEKAFLEWLSRDITSAWQQSDAYIPGINPTPLIETAVNSLIRSNPARIEVLQMWGLLALEDTEAILSREINFPSERIARMLIWTTAEHLNNWQPSASQLKETVKQFTPYHFIHYMAEKYKDQNVSFADVWYFATNNPSNPEETLNKALTAANDLANKYQAKGVTFADTWRFAVHYPSNPEEPLNKALTVVDRLANKYQAKGVTFADTWRFAVNNPSDPEVALNNALTTADRLAKKYQDKGVTFADAWYFAVHYSDPETELNKALTVADDLAKKYQAKEVTFADAWRFAVKNPSDPEAALITNNYRAPSGSR